MYFMLGSIAFEPVNLTDFSETHSAEFAEHAVLKGKPKLQAMGEKLAELSFAIRLHHQIGGVESRYQALLDAKAKQQALALIWGRGKYRGNFVITDMSSTTLYTDAQGNALCREISITLKEFIGNQGANALGAALNLGGGSLLGSLVPPSLVSGFNTLKETVQKGVTLYNAGKRAVDEVKNTVAVVRQLAHDPATALAYLPSALGNLDSALGSFGEASGLSPLLDGVRSVLPEVSQFSQEVDGIVGALSEMKQCFNKANANTDWDNWFTPADNALTEVNDRISNNAEAVAEMTAFVVLRTDEDNTQG